MKATKTQDPKFQIEIVSAPGDTIPASTTARLVGQSGPIPEEEPIFIIRARDVAALPALISYKNIATQLKANADHRAAVQRRIVEFDKFKKDHPDRMKVPDTDLSKLPPEPKAEKPEPAPKKK